MMKNKGVLGILILIILGVVFVSGCIQQEEDGADGQNGDGGEAIIPADLTQITFLEDLAADPSWSPDGSRIIFLGMDKNTYEGGFYVINSNGTGVAKVGQWGYDHLFNPSWSPVSNKIIGHGTDNEHHPYGLFLIDLDGDPTEQIQLTAQKAEMPSWSPDGTKIAYNVYSGDWSSSKYGYESSSIWIMDVNGSGQTQLTTEENGFCTAPSFSYDGSKIVYLKGFTSYMPEAKSAQQEPNEIWVMNSDGSDKHVIFAPGDSSTQNIRERAWNKNDEIIFSRFWYQQVTQIWVINSNGTNPRSILKPAETFGSDSDIVVYDDPVWDNSGTKVALTKVTSPAMPEESWQIATFSWEDGGDEQPSTVDFQFVRKIEVSYGGYPPLIFTNNHFYVSYESDEYTHVRVYDENFTPTGEEHQLTDEKGGDHQIVFADNYFYLVYIGSDNYLHLKKFDSDFNEIKKVAVNEHSPDMEQEGAWDMLFYYANGSLYIGTPVETPPTEGEIANCGLHMRIFDTNLEFQDDFYLSDMGSGFGLRMMLRDGIFMIVSSRNFEDALGSLIILRYDKDWNFIDEKRISFPETGEFSNEHYPRGFLFENGRYFISYTDPTKKGTEVADLGDITLKAFDSEWNLLGQTKVTNDILPDKGNRAHLALVGNKIYVAYDVLEEGMPYAEGYVSKVYVKEYDVIIND